MLYILFRSEDKELMTVARYLYSVNSSKLIFCACVVSKLISCSEIFYTPERAQTNAQYDQQHII